MPVQTWLDDGVRDARHAVRMLARAPGFAAVAVVTLALGIGANTAIFSVVNAVLLRPLPFEDADRLVRIVEHVAAAESLSGRPERRTGMRVDWFDDWRAHTTTLAQLALYANESMTLVNASGETTRLNGVRVSAAVFPMLAAGASVREGRVFDVSAERPGSNAVVVLSEDTWRKQFAADRAIIGRGVTLDGRAYEVIGVMSRSFEFPDRQTAFWTPLVPSDRQPGRSSFAGMIARLQDGVSLDAATAEANTIGEQLRRPSQLSLSLPQLQQPPPSPPPQRQSQQSQPVPPPHSQPQSPQAQHGDAMPRFEVVRVQDQLVAPVRPALIVLMMAVACVLAIACANVANLLLARQVARQREMAIRGALGAGRGRLVRQTLVESLVLGALGGIAAIAFGFGGIRAVKALASIDAPRWLMMGGSADAILPRAEQIALDGPVLAFTCGAALLTSLVFALAPVLHLVRIDPMRAMTVGALGSGAGGGRTTSRTLARGVLVIAEMAMATVLLIVATLLARSFVSLSRVPTGYDPANVLTFQVVLPPTASSTPARLAFAETLTTRLRSLPGMQAAGFTNLLPLSSGRWMLSFTIPGAAPELWRERRPQTRYVSRDYLRAMGVRILEGRGFGEQDAVGRPPVVLVNRTLARLYFHGASPVGTFVTFGKTPWEIVGIVDDIRQGALDTEPDPQFLVDFRQMPDTFIMFPDAAGVYFAVRTASGAGSGGSSDPIAGVPAIRSLVAQIEPRAALDSVFGMEQLVTASIARPRFYATLLGLFALMAATLAIVGIYGVLAYAVTQRTHEIGVRIALGAGRADVLRLILGQGAKLTATGILLGLAGAFAVTRYMSALLFGLAPDDPATFALVSVTFALTATLAISIPARRAMRADPLIALRHE